MGFLLAQVLHLELVKCSSITYFFALFWACLLYTSDAADERSSVDLGGRRIIKKKTSVDLGGRRLIKKQQKQKKKH